MYPRGTPWTGGRTRTLERKLRHVRRLERGLPRAAALAWRCGALRRALGAHWELCDRRLDSGGRIWDMQGAAFMGGDVQAEGPARPWEQESHPQRLSGA